MIPFSRSSVARRSALITPSLCLLHLTLAIVDLLGAGSLVVEGVHVVPHLQSTEMRYRKPTDFSLGARVEVFLRNRSSEPLSISPSLAVSLRGKTPNEHLQSDQWSWHSLPSAWEDEGIQLPPNALTVWSWNGKRAPWGTATATDLTVSGSSDGATGSLTIKITEPKVWLSAMTFLGEPKNPQPQSLLFHIANETSQALRVETCRLWLPETNASWRSLTSRPWLSEALERFPVDGWIPPNERGGARVSTGPLPLTYCALEVRLVDQRGTATTLWAHQRIKREVFDIGGGWVATKLGQGNTLQAEPYLRTLSRMHINTGMHQRVEGYSNTPLFNRYPLKYMNRLQPIEQYDTEEVLPRIHAVEFLGEPQYGGGQPVPPQTVWEAFAPYAPTRLPTSVTHSEERIWRFYAGLSDYPHYDAYRVNAPSPDAWNRYDRWNGERIRWGAPLETIGTMTRSLRILNRPRPIAYWSQGANGWGRYGGRARRSPTPDELRAQAYHGMAARITSLYWFNLSLKSLTRFRDLIAPITRVSRECLLLSELLIEGDAFEYRRESLDGNPSWDLSSVTGPRGGVLFAIDLAYEANQERKEFEFQHREGVFRFRLPVYLGQPAEVFALGGEGLSEVNHDIRSGHLVIRDQVTVAGIYLVSPTKGFKQHLTQRLDQLIAHERRQGFDPARRDADFAQLRGLLRESTPSR